MRALVQRVTRASVKLPGGETRRIGRGLLIYLGVGPQDDAAVAEKLAEKIAVLRVFPDEAGRFDRSASDLKADILLISQFTLYADCRKGRRPDFSQAAPPQTAKPIYDLFGKILRDKGFSLQTGEFGAPMDVESETDGPINFWLDTQSWDGAGAP
ncbi:MAG TPA: D-aminoacyl-tRNA deacylase [Elusimicrobiota bacterium]|nr:D-aminoacyl-tRNA deacylase [Elusimicrobiota bacterium]